MKDTVEVAALQMDIGRDVKANLERVRSTIDDIAATGPIDLVVLPELANCGYIKGVDRDFARDYFKLAEKVPGIFTNGLGEIATKHHIFIVAGMLQEHPVVPHSVYNSAVLIGPSGDVLGVHHKMHIPGEEKHYFYPGNTFQVVATELGEIGLQVCADASYPELTRTLALMGAEIVVTVFNGPTSASRTTSGMYFRACCRAMENTVFFIGCNRVGREDDTSTTYCGGSAIAAPDGQLIGRAPQQVEYVVRATLRAELLERERAKRPVLAARRPELYAPICENY